MNETIWEISGEEGKGFGSGRRRWDRCRFSDEALNFVSLGVDTLTFTVQPGAPRVPDDQEKLVLWRNGVRVFSGHVTARPFSFTGQAPAWRITVSGPAWHLANRSVTSLNDFISGDDAVQSAFIFEAADLAGSLRRVLEKAQADGVPLAPGRIDPAFPVTSMKFSNAPHLSILAEMMRWLPDAVTWIDYNAAPLPTFNIGRRDLLDDVTLRLGRDKFTLSEFTAHPELRPRGVAVMWPQSDLAGGVTYQPQTAGDTRDPQWTQVVVSGSEFEDAVAAAGSGTFVNSVYINPVSTAYELDSDIKSVKDQYGDPKFTYPGGSDLKLWNTSTGDGSQYTLTMAATGLKESGVGIGGSWYRLLSGTIPADIMSLYGIVQKTVTMECSLLVTLLYGQYAPSYITALSDAGISGWRNGVPSWDHDGANAQYRQYLRIPVATSTFPVINKLYPSQVLYNQTALDQGKPPTDLAKSLFLAQDWVPYEGAVSVLPDDWRSWMGAKLNVKGVDAAMARAGALVQGVSMNLRSPVVNLRCGFPARLGVRGLSDRFRRTSGASGVRKV